MASYEIKSIEPSSEEGFVYADVLINDEEELRRLIIPEATAEAQAVLEAYVQAEENAPEPVQPEVVAEVSELIDTPVEV